MPAPGNSDASPADLVAVYCSLSHPQRQQRFLSTAAIADRYGIAQRTVQDWINIGSIAAVKVGKKYQVDARSVEAYLQHCTQPH